MYIKFEDVTKSYVDVEADREGQTENHLEKNPRTGDEERRAVVEKSGTEGPRLERTEELRRWPVPMGI